MKAATTTTAATTAARSACYERDRQRRRRADLLAASRLSLCAGEVRSNGAVERRARLRVRGATRAVHQSSEGEGEGAKRAAAWREARASERERRRQRGAREREEKKLLRLGATGASAAERAVGAVARVVNQCRAHAESRAPVALAARRLPALAILAAPARLVPEGGGPCPLTWSRSAALFDLMLVLLEPVLDQPAGDRYASGRHAELGARAGQEGVRHALLDLLPVEPPCILTSAMHRSARRPRARDRGGLILQRREMDNR